MELADIRSDEGRARWRCLFTVGRFRAIRRSSIAPATGLQCAAAGKRENDQEGKGNSPHSCHVLISSCLLAAFTDLQATPNCRCGTLYISYPWGKTLNP